MELSTQIQEKVKNIIYQDFISSDNNSIPDISNSKLTFGNTGIYFEATVLYIDLRNSSILLDKHKYTSIAKIHLSYFYAILQIIKNNGGEVRSFNGDSMLVLFEGKSNKSINLAVRSAMEIKYIIDDEKKGINNLLKKYSKIDYGIGVDCGKIMCTKIGLGRNQNHQDLIWIGKAINRSTVISDNCNNPNNIGISKSVYENLDKYYLYDDINEKFLWSPTEMVFCDKNEYYYTTEYFHTVL